MIKLFENTIKSKTWRIKDFVKDTHKKSIIYETWKWIETYDTSQHRKEGVWKAGKGMDLISSD